MDAGQFDLKDVEDELDDIVGKPTSNSSKPGNDSISNTYSRHTGARPNSAAPGGRKTSTASPVRGLVNVGGASSGPIDPLSEPSPAPSSYGNSGHTADLGSAGALPASATSRARALAQQREMLMKKRQVTNDGMMRANEGPSELGDHQYTAAPKQFSLRNIDADPFGSNPKWVGGESAPATRDLSPKTTERDRGWESPKPGTDGRAPLLANSSRQPSSNSTARAWDDNRPVSRGGTTERERFSDTAREYNRDPGPRGDPRDPGNWRDSRAPEQQGAVPRTASGLENKRDDFDDRYGRDRRPTYRDDRDDRGYTRRPSARDDPRGYDRPPTRERDTGYGRDDGSYSRNDDVGFPVRDDRGYDRGGYSRGEDRDRDRSYGGRGGRGYPEDDRPGQGRGYRDGDRAPSRDGPGRGGYDDRDRDRFNGYGSRDDRDRDRDVPDSRGGRGQDRDYDSRRGNQDRKYPNQDRADLRYDREDSDDGYGRNDRAPEAPPAQESQSPRKIEYNPDALNLSDMRRFLMSPVPKEAGTMQCTILRNKAGTNKLFPEYTVYTKISSGQERFLMTGKKRAGNKTSNYLISSEKGDMNRSSSSFLGKLRANFVGTEFQIYDDGANPKDMDPDRNEQPRRELGVVLYASNMMGARGPRKMQIFLPTVEGEETIREWRPMNKHEDMLSAAKREDRSNLMYLINKPPRWNDEVGAYVLNFNGRVTMASVKNFQLIEESHAEDVLLQFGRIAKEKFTMDFQWPLSPFQAFAVTLSSFDSKIACD